MATLENDLKQHIKKNKITAYSLEQKTGITRSTINRWINGGEIAVSRFEQLVKACGLTARVIQKPRKGK